MEFDPKKLTEIFYGEQLSVVCSGLSHEGKVAKIIRFNRRRVTEDDIERRDRSPVNNPGWNWSRGEISPNLRIRTKSGPDWPRPYDDIFVGDTPIGPQRHPDLDPRDDGNRRRRTMECPLCGIKVDARAEKLYPILDKLVDHGVSVVELAHLARILST